MILKMIINIFSIFDPSTSRFISLNWIRILIGFFLLPYQYWFSPSQLRFFWFLTLNFIFTELKILINYRYSNLIIFIRLLIIILFNNLFGLFPYIFTASSHIRFCFSLSVSIWLRIIIYRTLNYFNVLFAHLMPQGTPLILMPFIVIIESISLIIRPVTLSVRLMANITAGHLLISLIGSSFTHITSLNFIILAIFSQLILFILEISVSLIQAYVFTILSTLYSREI